MIAPLLVCCVFDEASSRWRYVVSMARFMEYRIKEYRAFPVPGWDGAAYCKAPN